MGPCSRTGKIERVNQVEDRALFGGVTIGSSDCSWHGNDRAIANRALPFLVILQRWNEYVSPFRAGATCRLAGVSQGLLGESFGIAGGLGTLSPCIPIAVQGNASDTQSLAAAPKFPRPVRLPLVSVAGKE